MVQEETQRGRWSVTTRKKILIVEDEILSALSLKATLEDWGYELCEPATSGEEAIQAAGSELPDIILMDVKIKGEIGGVEAAREISSRFDTSIIFMSGYSQESLQKMADMKAITFLSKPLDNNQLEKILESTPPQRRESKTFFS
jgi:CheY-like chemotaxis protein